MNLPEWMSSIYILIQTIEAFSVKWMLGVMKEFMVILCDVFV